MMTMALDDAVGWQRRFADDEHPRKRDRKATVRYGARQEVKPDGLSGAEFYAMNNDLYIGESCIDTLPANEPPYARPGIQRLAMLTYTAFPEHVLVECSTKDARSTLTMAVLAEYIGSRGGTMLQGPFRAGPRPRPVTGRIRKQWADKAGLGQVMQCVEELSELANERLVEVARRQGLDGLVRLGDGPLRDYEFAGLVARERLADGWTQKRIRAYLQVFGFFNSAGTVGRWGHSEFERLVSQS
jgi:hypothetical protein